MLVLTATLNHMVFLLITNKGKEEDGEEGTKEKKQETEQKKSQPCLQDSVAI